MNFLLWDSQQGGRKQIGGTVPVEHVWQKVLTAPDNSSLEIFHHGKKIGYCRWVANVVGNSALASGKVNSEEYQPEGMVSVPTGYTLDLEGNAALGSNTNRLRFDSHLKLSTNQSWQEFHLRASLRPNNWEVHANATSESLRLVLGDEAGTWQKTFKFADLRDPETLLQQFEGASYALSLLGGVNPLLQKNAISKLALGLKWTARNDWMKFGHSQVRVFRLEAHLIGRYNIFIFVSRVGEILWVELPDEIILSNEAFSHF